MASIAASSADGRRSSCVVVDGDDLGDVVDDDAGEPRRRLDDDDLLLGDVLRARAAEARGEVVDGDDLAAQADDAADPVHGRGDRARLGVADDLVDVGDGERVLLVAQAEDDELARDGFLGHDVGNRSRAEAA